MGESCPQCIPEVQGKDICPICLTEGHGNPEHMAGCKGKPPRKKKEPAPKKNKAGLVDDGRTLEQIHRDATAQSGLQARREAEAALKAMSPDERLAYQARLKEEHAAQKAKKGAADAKVLAGDKAALVTDRCPTCNTFLDDRGRCANDECDDKGKKPAMWED
jgi:hypothetical protein